MKHTKIEFAITNKLYGDRLASGYGSGGLVACKSGKDGWTIYHVPSGSPISSRHFSVTRAVALQKIERLLQLPVKWQKPWDEMHVEFRDNAPVIRDIVAGL